MTSGRWLTRTRSWPWRIMFPPRPPRRCWNWLPGARRNARLRGATDRDPFAHPDAQRRFGVMSNQEELRRALDYPWEKWTVFLHPAQRQVVERSYRGPARVSGSAGTGKTIVALHRAVHLARIALGRTRAADHVFPSACGRVARTSGATHRQ